LEVSRLYRFEAVSEAGFVQQLAVAYLAHGYYYYVAGCVPEGKDPASVDAKLLAKYGVGVSRWARARRKRAGAANVHYLRHGRFFVLVATPGAHEFFAEETGSIRDFRRDSLSFAGYSIGWKRGRDGKGHPSVRIHPRRYLELKSYLLELACHRSVGKLADEFRRLPFEPYAPVRDQLRAVLRAVNAKRKAAGFAPVPFSALRLRRPQVRPFVEERRSEAEAA
jgi:hypothetical protein